MRRASSSPFLGPRPPLRLSLALGPACLLLSLGCSPIPPLPLPPSDAVVRAQAPQTLPPTLPPQPAPEAAPAEVAPAAVPHVLPINLDTVLRLAQDQNGQVAVAREKLNEAFAQQDVAARSWLPDLWVGTAYYRHEGGIQNEDGTLTHSSFGALLGGLELGARVDLRDVVYQKIDAERKVWQQRGELSRLTSEALLDAANTYVDLLFTRSGEVIALRQDAYLRDLLDRAVKLAKIDPGAEVEAVRIRKEVSAQKQSTRQLREGAKAAAAKLLYLLGLDPSAELVPADRQLVAFRLVDVGVPVEQLVERALAGGPGVRELEGLLNLIQQAQAKSQGLGALLPTLDVRMAEGVFGAGPG